MFLDIFNNRKVILNYHRICDDNALLRPNDELVVSASKFREQLNFLKKNCNIVSLDTLLNLKKSNKLNVSITFDDGYKDNLKNALPILNDLNIPATIYVITKFLEKKTDVWWYELEEYLWQNSENIKFTYNQKNYDLNVRNNAEKSKSFKKLREIIKKLDEVEQKKFLKVVTKKDSRKQFGEYFLNKEDLNFLSCHPLITIGAHTHNHLSLKNLTKNDCFEEISRSKRILEDLLGIKVNHFSYPYGTKSDAGKREFKIVKELGFKSAVTTVVGEFSKDKLFNLPRIHINEKVNERMIKFKISFYYIIYSKIKSIINFFYLKK